MSVVLVSAIIATVAAVVSIAEACRRFLHNGSSRKLEASVTVGHALGYGPQVIDLNRPDATQIKRYVLVVTILNGDQTQFLKRLCIEDAVTGDGVDVSRYLDMEAGGSTPRELKPREPVLAEIPSFEMTFDGAHGFQVIGYFSIGRVASGIEYLDSDLLRALEEHNATVG